MTVEVLVATGATLISIFSVFYARRAAHEARSANNIGRLNALLALRGHYLDLIDHQIKLAELFKNSPGGAQKTQEAYANLDVKLREVSNEVEKYHTDLVDKKI